MLFCYRLLVVLSLLFIFYAKAEAKYGQIGSNDTDGGGLDLMELSLEDLLNTEIVSASKKAQKIEQAPAAIFVITAQDIRSYGFVNIGEALRLVPGLDVIQGGDQNYQISARGLNRTAFNMSNKVLFLVNGRNVYSDIFGGAMLETFNVPMSDIERIEVIRGPGSSLYGANAFAGLVNIITKDASQEQGLSVNANFGNLNQSFSSVRYATPLGDNTDLMIGLLFENIDQKQARLLDTSIISELSPEEFDNFLITRRGSILGAQPGSNNAMRSLGANFQIKHTLDIESHLNFYGGFNSSQANTYWIVPGETNNNNFFAQAEYRDTENFARLYFNGQTNGLYEQSRNLNLVEPLGNTPESQYLAAQGRQQFVPHTDTRFIYQQIDFEYQRSQDITDNLSVIAGVNYRRNFARSNVFSVDGASTLRNIDIAAGYAQFEWNPTDYLTVGLGARADWHTFVGLNVNPRLTAVATLADGHTLRLGAGTATRNPAIFDNVVDNHARLVPWRAALQQAAANLPPQAAALAPLIAGLNPVLNLTASGEFIALRAFGSEDINAEQLASFELGYNWKVSNTLQVRADLFYNIMNNAITFSGVQRQESIEQIENVRAILQAAGVPEQQAAMLPNTVNEATALQLIQQFGSSNPQLAGLFQVLHSLFLQTQNGANTAPLGGKVLTTFYRNNPEQFVFYGGELSVLYAPTSFLTFNANYGITRFNEEYNSLPINVGLPSERRVPVLRDSEHRFTIAARLRLENFTLGAMFNYSSPVEQFLDYNLNNALDEGDLAGGNSGIFTVPARTNLNIQLSYDFGNFELYALGMNLLQDGYRQYEATVSIPFPADPLSLRIMGGMRIAL